MTLKDIGLAGATLRQVDSSHRDTERETDRVKNQSNYKRAEGWSSGRIKRRADHRKIWHWRETLDTFRRVFLFCGQFPIYDIPSTVPQGSVEKLNKENWKSVTRIFQSLWKTKVLNLTISPFFFHVSYNHKKYIILACLRYFLVFIISFCRTFKSGWSVITIYERNDLTIHYTSFIVLCKVRTWLLWCWNIVDSNNSTLLDVVSFIYLQQSEPYSSIIWRYFIINGAIENSLKTN